MTSDVGRIVRTVLLLAVLGFAVVVGAEFADRLRKSL